MPATPSRGTLLSELDRISTLTGRTPTQDDLHAYSAFTVADYEQQFESWTKAVEAAGIEHRLPGQQSRAGTDTATDHSGNDTNNKYSDAELLEALRELSAELGAPPTSDEMRNQGPHSPSTYAERFGSWSNAIESAGLEPHSANQPISEEELLAEIHRLHETLGRSPTLGDLEEQGNYHESTYYRRFDSWSSALEAAGLEGKNHRREQKIEQSELLNDIRRIADVLGRSPTEREYTGFGDYALSTQKDRFGSWSDALLAAGVESRGGDSSSESRIQIPDAELFAEIRRVSREVERVPTMEDMRDHSQYSVPTYQNRFGTWTTALRMTGLTPGTGTRRIPDWKLVEDLRRLAIELNRAPTRLNMDSVGEHAGTTYMRRFGSWMESLKAAGLSRKTDAEDVLVVHCDICSTILKRVVSEYSDHRLFFCCAECQHLWNSANVIRFPEDLPETSQLSLREIDRLIEAEETFPGELITYLQIAADLERSEFDSLTKGGYSAVFARRTISVWPPYERNGPIIQFEISAIRQWNEIRSQNKGGRD